MSEATTTTKLLTKEMKTTKKNQDNEGPASLEIGETRPKEKENWDELTEKLNMKKKELGKDSKKHKNHAQNNLRIR